MHNNDLECPSQRHYLNLRIFGNTLKLVFNMFVLICHIKVSTSLILNGKFPTCTALYLVQRTSKHFTIHSVIRPLATGVDWQKWNCHTIGTTKHSDHHRQERQVKCLDQEHKNWNIWRRGSNRQPTSCTMNSCLLSYRCPFELPNLAWGYVGKKLYKNTPLCTWVTAVCHSRCSPVLQEFYPCSQRHCPSLMLF